MPLNRHANSINRLVSHECVEGACRTSTASRTACDRLSVSHTQLWMLDPPRLQLLLIYLTNATIRSHREQSMECCSDRAYRVAPRQVKPKPALQQLSGSWARRSP
jgi:hypothetical protein